MATYAGATFHGSRDGSGFSGRWAREKTIVRRKLGSGNSEDLQDLGFGNYFLAREIYVPSDSGLATLQAAVGLTKRTLGDVFGQSWSNVMLTSFGQPKRHISEQAWLVDVRFEYEAA